MPTNLSDLLGTNNLKFATVALTATSGANSQSFTQNIWHKIPFNAVYSNPYGICTLNTSLSTITLPAGLYQICPSTQPGYTNTGAWINTRLRDGSSTISKWPTYWCGTTNSSLDLPGSQTFTPASLYLSTQSSITFEQYWSNSAYLQGNLVSDGESNIFYKLDVYKLK